jgi:hypothetical protein
MVTRFDNKINRSGYSGSYAKPTVRKVGADSVPFGSSISHNGRTVWAAYNGETLVAVAAPADEARRKYRTAWLADEKARWLEREGAK